MLFDTIDHSACYAKSTLRFIMISTAMISASLAAANGKNQLLGIKYISYNNFDGTLANGDCCDEPGKKAGACSPDLCDTAFYPCGTTDAKEECNCNVMQSQQSPITFNNNTFKFGTFMGNGVNRSSSFIVLKFPFDKHNIEFTITAVETPEEGIHGEYQDIAQFHFLIDWVDPIYLNPPKFRRQVLNDTRAQLVVDVVSQCNKHYYTHDCSVYCEPDKEHFICLDNGTVQCLPGWSGPRCLAMIDHCPGNKCQHNSDCVPILQNYTCICTHGYTGDFCETTTQTTTKTTTKTNTKTNTETNTEPNTETDTNTTTETAAATMAPPSHTSTIDDIIEQGERSKSKSGGSGDDDNVAGTAAGVTVGVLLLGTVAVLLVFFIVKKKKRMSQVAPGDNPPLDTELTTDRCMDAYVVGHDEFQVATVNNPPLDTELTTERRMEAYVVGHDESQVSPVYNPPLDTELTTERRMEAYVVGHDESQVASEDNPPLDTELTTERRMEAYVVGHDE